MMERFYRWSRWYNFNEVYDYQGPIDESGSPVSKIKGSWQGKVGPLHTDNGFRLRNYNGGSFKHTKLMIKLSDIACPLKQRDVGVYWIKIKFKNNRWDYIGQCSEKKSWGIHKRLMDHFSKIAGFVKSFRKQMSDTKKFRDMRRFFKTNNIDSSLPKFFDKNVQLSFVKVPHKKKLSEEVSKIEGMTLQSFKNFHGEFPKLNDTDETRGLDEFQNLLK